MVAEMSALMPAAIMTKYLILEVITFSNCIYYFLLVQPVQLSIEKHLKERKTQTTEEKL